MGLGFYGQYTTIKKKQKIGDFANKKWGSCWPRCQDAVHQCDPNSEFHPISVWNLQGGAPQDS